MKSRPISSILLVSAADRVLAFPRWLDELDVGDATAFRLLVTRSYTQERRKLSRAQLLVDARRFVEAVGERLGAAIEVHYQQRPHDADWLELSLYSTCDSHNAVVTYTRNRRRRTT
jgi:hypothetical protein